MLQEQFNEMVFAAENRLLASEGIAVDTGALQSSATRLALMTRLLQALDDQCRLGERGSDKGFLDEIGRSHTKKGTSGVEVGTKAPKPSGGFFIVHYAGRVTYTAEGFVLKNADTLSPQVLQLAATAAPGLAPLALSLIHISEPTRPY